MLLRLTLMVVILLAATQAMSQTVRVRWEPTTDFDKYQTYAWLEGTRVKDAHSHRFIVEYVDGQLGVNSVFKDENEPDLYAVYHAAAEGSFEITGGYGSDWKGANAITVNNHVAGTLVVDLVDAAENQLVWRGIATATVSSERKKNQDTIRKAVEKMFADFPPGTR
jgi:hypothetical protein